MLWEKKVMQDVQYHMIYLAACGVNRIKPEEKYLEKLNIEILHQLSKIHFLDALVGSTLKQTKVMLPEEWSVGIAKAVRKNILFDTERSKLFSYMEKRGIWYLPLKGIILKDMYPATGLRQMSDNDILFDKTYSDVIKEYMEQQGYETVSFGKGNHDTYTKAPIYNFEMHTTLYNLAQQEGWEEYYKDVKNRLYLNADSSYGYHFSDEDFYVYILSHAYKHYAGCGTGLRTLLDFYVYLQNKEQTMDFSYIQKECEALGIAAFEEQNRSLCKKVFGKTDLQGMEVLEAQLSEAEYNMLLYYLTSGAYGTNERKVNNRLEKYRKEKGRYAKLHYFWNRAFPADETLKNYSLIYKHKWLMPIGWIYRMILLLLDENRRKIILKEIGLVLKK